MPWAPTYLHTESVSWVRATAVRWVSDEPFPGWVEVHLALADGSAAVFNDKPPIFEDGDRLRPDTDYPIGITLACRIESGFDAGRDAVLVTLENSASDPAGAVACSVPRDNVTLTD